MRVASAVLAGLGSAAIIGLGWQAGVAGVPSAIQASSAAGSSAPASNGSAGSEPGSPATPSPAAPSTDGTWTGSLVDTRYGTVQVQAVISGGTLTDVIAVKLTDDGGRSVQISNRAAPILRDEVLASQSANVSNVSGATYTTDGYLESLQAALDQAGL